MNNKATETTTIDGEPCISKEAYLNREIYISSEELAELSELYRKAFSEPDFIKNRRCWNDVAEYLVKLAKKYDYDFWNTKVNPKTGKVEEVTDK